MTTTAELDITHLEQNQNSPEVTVNEALDRLDAAIADILTHEMTTDADYTLGTSGEPPEWMYAVIRITDSPSTLTAARNIIVPTAKRIYVFQNNTAQTLTIKTSAGTGIAVAASGVAIVRCDGTNVVLVTDAYDNSIGVTSGGTTGGTGSAGAGNQYVEMTINGTTYKVLHDGTV